MLQIEVAISFSVHNTYTYLVPDDLVPLVAPGKRVLVPFGSRRITGYVLGEDSRQHENNQLKPIHDVLDDTPMFPESMIGFFRWMADYYLHPIGDVICEALPGGINPSESAVYELSEPPANLSGQIISDQETQILLALGSGPSSAAQIEKKAGFEIPANVLQKLTKKGWIIKRKQIDRARIRSKMRRYAVLTEQTEHLETPGKFSEPKKRILGFLRKNGETPVDRLSETVPTAGAHVRDLAAKGYIKIIEKSVLRDPFGEAVEPDTPPELTIEQKVVVKDVTASLNKAFCTYLLAGVTGSGKTEVYMHLAANTLETGRSVIVLVPEIALISQIERRFRARFGENVAVLHSGLSSGEKLDQWMRIVRGDSMVAIGARSAIFAPFANPGLIIVDEEHDTSYKQESRFHYNARDMAVVRASQAGAIALLGSATPSVQSISNVGNRKFRELNLKRRVHRQALPEVTIVDLRKQKDERGTSRFITPELRNEMKKALDRKEQVLLFLNRRGFASYPVCGRCGEPQKCRNCDITLTLHKKSNIYKCHMCGYFKAAVSVCTNCGSNAIKHLGMGTEKIETAVGALFPDARIARMDRDTTTRKGSLLKMLKALKNQEIDILVGTQMVAKGHDFPNITLVGIICADSSLSFPDFRAGETTFQVLAQVAGRAGRGTAKGNVILQTYNPDHFAIIAAQQQDFMSFYNQEIRFRKALDYPPFSRMLQIKISGKDKESTQKHAEISGRLCRQLSVCDDRCRTVEIMGPIEAPLSRVAGRYRWQILLKASDSSFLRHFIRRLYFENNTHFSNRNVQTAFDVDPLFMM